MISILRKIWPLIFVACLFAGSSMIMQSNGEYFLGLLSSVPPYAVILIYFCIALATVLIPFTSVLPFVPVAVLLLGWQATALITFLAWLTGSQILFELSRSFAQPYVLKFLPREHVENIGKMLAKKGLSQVLLVRMFVHDDLISVAFAVFTPVTRCEFLLVTALATAPGAVLYAYLGSVPFHYALGLAFMGVTMFVCFLVIDARKHHIMNWLKMKVPFAWR